MGNFQPIDEVTDKTIAKEVLKGNLKYKDLPEEKKSVPLIAQSAIYFDNQNLNYFPENKLRDIQFLTAVLSNNFPINFQNISNEIQKIHEIRCIRSLTTDPFEFDSNWQSDDDLVVFMLQNDVKRGEYPEKFFKDEYLVKRILEKNPQFIKQFKGTEESSVYLYAIEMDPMLIEYFPEYVRDDFNIMMKTIEYSGLLLAYASRRLKSDKQLVLEAVKESSDAMSHVSKEFRSNKMIMMEVVRKQPMALFYASEELKKDLDVVIPAVEKNYQCLIYLPFELRNTQPIYLASRKMYQKMIPNSESLIKLENLQFRFH
jgi:hypothetical protein